MWPQRHVVESRRVVTGRGMLQWHYAAFHLATGMDNVLPNLGPWDANSEGGELEPLGMCAHSLVSLSWKKHRCSCSRY